MVLCCGTKPYCCDARMGLGFFTRPGAEEGQLTTTVKIGPDGIVTLNETEIVQLPGTAPTQ